MRINKILLLFILILIVTGCTKITERDAGESQKRINSTQTQIENSKLDEFLGEWKISSFLYGARTANIDYLKTINIGKELVITKNEILLDDESYKLDGFDEFSPNDLMEHYNIILGDALSICGGKLSVEGDVISSGVKVIDYTLKNESKAFSLLIRPNGTIIVHLGELFDTDGFYELEKVEK